MLVVGDEFNVINSWISIYSVGIFSLCDRLKCQVRVKGLARVDERVRTAHRTLYLQYMVQLAEALHSITSYRLFAINSSLNHTKQQCTNMIHTTNTDIPQACSDCILVGSVLLDDCNIADL